MDKRKKNVSKLVSRFRTCIQAGATLLTNIHLPNFFKGGIYQGNGKTVCVPGLNCYSCPAASGACPIGSFQAVVGSSKFKFSYYVTGDVYKRQDDTGWRIEIKKYPLLTEIGSKRAYTQINGWGSTCLSLIHIWLTITFLNPDKKEYLDIVEKLANDRHFENHGVDMDKLCLLYTSESQMMMRHYKGFLD